MGITIEGLEENMAVAAREQPSRRPPPKPAKPKALSDKVDTSRRDYTTIIVEEETDCIQLIDLEDNGGGNSYRSPREARQFAPLEYNKDHLTAWDDAPAKRTPSPFNNLLSAWQTVSQGTLTAAKNVQSQAPKTFQTIATGTTKAFATAQSEVTSNFGTGLAAARGFVNGIPIPAPLRQTGEDFSDLTKLALGNADICSKCASLPLKRAFEESLSPATLPTWTTPLSRVLLHRTWCRMCQFILSMLCRPENDPLRSQEVQMHIQPERLRGLTFGQWLDEGYMDKDQYWPFGRSESRHEGALQVVGPAVDVFRRAAVRSAATNKTKSSRVAYARGRREGMKVHKQYPFSCVIAVFTSGKDTPTPGLCWVDVVGCSNKTGSEQQVLSHFIFRGLRQALSVHASPSHSISYGHILDPRGIDLAIGRLWLTECETRHGKRCDEHGWSIVMPKPNFLRLIDVHDVSIVIAKQPASCRYVALSYIWGAADMIKLRHDNSRELSQPRGLARHLPRLPNTVLDAMEVVKELGERYLWVDALCILQERTAESEQHISNMDSVYGNALLTIVAGQGTSANSGLSGVRRQHFVPGPVNNRRRSVEQKVAKFQGDISIIAPYASPQTLHTSPWNTRAWTFQERLLSRRLLIFANDEVTWHCRTTIAREDMPVEESKYPVKPLQWLSLRTQYFGVGTDPHWKDGSFVMNRHGYTHLVRSATFAEYAKVVTQYSRRNMTYEQDAVKALSGLLRIFSMCFQSECIFGLPASLLDVAILWRPLEPLKKRDSALGFPSWSWAAWKGSKTYADPIKIRQDEMGSFMEVEGIRPMLRYFRVEKHTEFLVPLNGTGRGLPMTDAEIPAEWDAHRPAKGCNSAVHSCKDPELFEIDPRAIPELDDRHLIFWSSTSDDFQLQHVPFQQMPQGQGGPTHMFITNEQSRTSVGDVLLDSHGLLQLERGRHIFILLAEAHGPLFGKSTEPEYPYYAVMLAETNPKTGIMTRLGIGRITKLAWVYADPVLKLICLR